jgi:hypothetical protein
MSNSSGGISDLWSMLGLGGILGTDSSQLASQQYEEGQNRFNINTGKLEGLIGKYQGKNQGALNRISDLFNGGTSGMNNAVNNTSADVSKYLSKGQDYISAMLDTNKKMANSNMPGLDIYNDTQSSTLASNIAQMKALGGANSNTLSQQLLGNQKNKANLALSAANYKMGVNQSLANAYSSASQGEQGMAGARENLGQMQLGNATNQWANELNWQETQATANDPLKFAADVYGNEAGIGWSQQQSGLTSKQQSDQASIQNAISIASIIAAL